MFIERFLKFLSLVVMQLPVHRVYRRVRGGHGRLVHVKGHARLSWPLVRSFASFTRDLDARAALLSCRSAIMNGVVISDPRGEPIQ